MEKVAKELLETKQFYNKNAENWAARKSNSFYNEKEFRKFIKYLKKGDRVIDIGCAHGANVPLFLGIGHFLKYEGLDVSKSMLKIAKSRYPQLNFYLADISKGKAIPKKKYDAFWASAVLMHVPFEKWEVMLQNIERLIKPSGYGFITLPEQRPNPRSEEDPRHFELFSAEQVKDFLKKRGWKILSSKPFYPMNGTVWNWFIVKLP